VISFEALSYNIWAFKSITVLMGFYLIFWCLNPWWSGRQGWPDRSYHNCSLLHPPLADELFWLISLKGTDDLWRIQLKLGRRLLRSVVVWHHLFSASLFTILQLCISTTQSLTQLVSLFKDAEIHPAAEFWRTSLTDELDATSLPLPQHAPSVSPLASDVFCELSFLVVIAF
jgi:hypothetical protein